MLSEVERSEMELKATRSGALATECRKLLVRTSGLGVNEPTSFFATNIVCTLGHVYIYRNSMPSRRHGVPISYSKCVVSLRKDYAQEVANQIKSMIKLKEVLRYQIKGNHDPAFHLLFGAIGATVSITHKF